MRRLTFKGFLQAYLSRLSGHSGCNIRKLALEAADGNPRLWEPLVLYACVAGKLHLLRNTPLRELPAALCQSGEQVVHLLESGSELLTPECHKVWRSFQSIAGQQAGEDQTKRLMRKKVLQLQREKSISNYRLYKDLGLNPGNVNAWLKNDDPSKVSLNTARQIMNYAVQR